MHLRDVVTRDDIQEAMRVTIQSFVGAQKISVKKSFVKDVCAVYSPKESEIDFFILPRTSYFRIYSCHNLGAGVNQSLSQERSDTGYGPHSPILQSFDRFKRTLQAKENETLSGGYKLNDDTSYKGGGAYIVRNSEGLQWSAATVSSRGTPFRLRGDQTILFRNPEFN
jgi:hypothetical protein